MLSPLYGYSMWIDVNIYHIIGNGIFNDKVIYRDLFDHKGPYIFFLYGLGSLFSSSSFYGIFLIELFLFSICLSFVYKIFRLFLTEKLSLLCSVLFPLFYFLYSGLGGAAEDFVLIAEVISLYYVLVYFIDKNIIHRPAFMIVHGVMIGFVLLLKLNLVVFWFFPLLYIFLSLIKHRKYKNLLYNILSLFIGILISFLPVLIYFGYNNAFSDFFEGYIHFNFLYGNQMSDSILSLFVSNLKSLKLFDIIVLIAYFLGIIYLFFKNSLEKRTGLIFLVLSFIAEFLSFLVAFYLFDYYWIVFVVFSVFPMIAFVRLFEKRLVIFSYFKLTVVLCCIVSIVLCCFKTRLFGYSFDNIVKREFPNKEIDVFSEILDKDKNATLLCLGFDKTLSIYTIRDMVPNVRFFFLPNIKIETYPLIYDEQIKYIREKRTDYLVIDDYFRYYNAYINIVKENYEPVASYPNHVGTSVRLYKKK